MRKTDHVAGMYKDPTGHVMQSPQAMVWGKVKSFFGGGASEKTEKAVVLTGKDDAAKFSEQLVKNMNPKDYSSKVNGVRYQFDKTENFETKIKNLDAKLVKNLTIAAENSKVDGLNLYNIGHGDGKRIDMRSMHQAGTAENPGGKTVLAYTNGPNGKWDSTYSKFISEFKAQPSSSQVWNRDGLSYGNTDPRPSTVDEYPDAWNHSARRGADGKEDDGASFMKFARDDLGLTKDKVDSLYMDKLHTDHTHLGVR